MKKFICVLSLIVCGIGLKAEAQSSKPQHKTYNVFYAQDAPYVVDEINNQKMIDLENKFRAYAKAYDKNDAKTLSTLKPQILQWRNDNNAWINNLEASHKQLIDSWLSNAFKSLRLSDNK